MKCNLEFPDNVTLNFDARGLVLRVSLNIPDNLVPYMSPNNVHKGNIHWVYAIETRIHKLAIDKKRLEEVKNELLLRAMANIRKAKSRKYEADSIKMQSLTTKQLKIW